MDEKAVRKSQRHRRQRGEKEMKVSSDLTLRAFKIKVLMYPSTCSQNDKYFFLYLDIFLLFVEKGVTFYVTPFSFSRLGRLMPFSFRQIPGT